MAFRFLVSALTLASAGCPCLRAGLPEESRRAVTLPLWRDWVVGDEEQLRKTVSVRSKGRNAQFTTVIEPYESQSLVKNAGASGPGKLKVELADGRVQEMTVHNPSSDSGNAAVSMTESRDGKVARKESAGGNAP